MHVSRALVQCRGLLERTRGNRMTHAEILGEIAWLEGMAGQFPEARTDVAKASAILDEIAAADWGWLSSQGSGQVELLAEDPAAAEHHLIKARTDLPASGKLADVALLSLLLAEALYRQGRYPDAEQHAEIARIGMDDQDLYPRRVWRNSRRTLRLWIGDRFGP
jgi:hypothetical protein